MQIERPAASDAVAAPSASTERTARSEPAKRASSTIYEVAERAGVSIATVSHALNRPERVADGTRRRVLETAHQLGFVPRGRGPGPGALRRIAVIAPLGQHPTYLQRLLGVLAAAAPSVDVSVLDDSPGTGAPVISSVPVRGRIDGLIIMGAEPTAELAEHLENTGVHTVLLDRPSQRFTSVTVSDESGGALVAEHLVANGAREVAWVSPEPPPTEFVTNGELRLRGFTTRLRELGHRGEVSWVIADDSSESVEHALTVLLEMSPRPDAVFALHDAIAIRLAVGLRDRGMRVPEDIRVVGYDDAEAADLFGLTTVRQPFRESGVAAMEALSGLVASPDRPAAHINLIPTLVVRASSPRAGR